MTYNTWRISLSNCEMWLVSRRICLLVLSSTSYARPVCFLFDILVNCVRTLVLLDGGDLDRCVLDLVFCAGDVVLIAGFLGYILLFSYFMFGYHLLFHPCNYWCGYCRKILGGLCHRYFLTWFVVVVQQHPQNCWVGCCCCRCCWNIWFVVDFSLCYSNKLFHFVGAVDVAQVLDGFGAFCYWCHHFICMCDGGTHTFPMAEVYCICELLVAGVF